jgi:hypothetical protein
MISLGSRQRNAVAIVVVKSVHSVIFLGMAACVFHTLYAGLTGRVSALTMISIAVILGEGLVLLVNRGRCPLTDLVESLGSPHGSVSDIFLPAWFTPHIPTVFSTLFVIGLIGIGLHRLSVLR